MLPVLGRVAHGEVLQGKLALALCCTLLFTGATVAERLAGSSPTKAIRVQSPAGRLRIIACENSAGRCCWSAGFLGDHPFPPPIHSGAALIPPSITLFGSQDLDVKSRPNLFAHYSLLVYTSTTTTYTRQKVKSKYRNRIRLQRASQKQSSDIHKTPYDRLKPFREQNKHQGVRARQLYCSYGIEQAEARQPSKERPLRRTPVSTARARVVLRVPPGGAACAGSQRNPVKSASKVCYPRSSPAEVKLRGRKGRQESWVTSLVLISAETRCPGSNRLENSSLHFRPLLTLRDH
ncbi:hypothetical protein PR048_023964 [Dryococelus australis]|uniref:Uncharacterized protein n=1 Tax=Dryococelus australis TaxID=614101 RepID=A0ABQ9GVJ8_9NEOP|nr:hypothetical protein PR048_023964 [Dryococelus australis]